MTTVKELLDEINDMEDFIMHTYTYVKYAKDNLRSKQDQAMLDEVKERYRKGIKVDETAFTAATEEELIQKLEERLEVLEKLNNTVYDMMDEDDDMYEEYE